jgi:release factor glutamine methyltransferase
MPDAPWTIGRLLSWTTDFLREKGAENPRLDAEVLLAFARNCKRIELYTAFEEPASDELRDRFRGLVKERAAGKPVAYLVGQREFFSLPFAVTPDVLIPRPETELIIVRALDIVKESAKEGDSPNMSLVAAELEIADVGTGSGILAVTLAKHLPRSRVTAIDVSPAAIAVAQRNAERHGVAERIEWVEGDLFAAVDPSQKFDLVVSNPPYVSTAELTVLANDVRRFEPIAALDGGERGTNVIERLLPQAADRLRSDGWLLMEISPTIVERVEQLVDARPRFERRPTLKDAAGLPRVVQVRPKEAP